MNGLVTYSRIRFIISMSSTFQNCNCSGSNYNTLSHWWLKIEWTTIYSWMGLVKGLLNRVLPELRCGWFGPGTGHTGHYHDFCNCFRVRCHQARELPLQLEPWTIDQKNLYIYIGSLLTYSDTLYSSKERSEPFHFFITSFILFLESVKNVPKIRDMDGWLNVLGWIQWCEDFQEWQGMELVILLQSCSMETVFHLSEWYTWLLPPPSPACLKNTNKYSNEFIEIMFNSYQLYESNPTSVFLTETKVETKKWLLIRVVINKWFAVNWMTNLIWCTAPLIFFFKLINGQLTWSLK